MAARPIEPGGGGRRAADPSPVRPGEFNQSLRPALVGLLALLLLALSGGLFEHLRAGRTRVREAEARLARTVVAGDSAVSSRRAWLEERTQETRVREARNVASGVAENAEMARLAVLLAGLEDSVAVTRAAAARARESGRRESARAARLGSSVDSLRSVARPLEAEVALLRDRVLRQEAVLREIRAAVAAERARGR